MRVIGRRECVDFDQTDTDTLFGQGNEVISFW